MNLFDQQNTEFQRRHNGPNATDTKAMLQTIGVNSLDELIDKTVPAGIRLAEELNTPAAISEFEYLNELKAVAAKNKLYKTYIGQGYYGTITPSVILRNIFENQIIGAPSGNINRDCWKTFKSAGFLFKCTVKSTFGVITAGK